MSELLLELLSEEIPARMQARAAEHLQSMVLAGLRTHGLPVGQAQAFATPRRLTLTIANVAAGSPAVTEERKGPRVGAPERAVAGFLKAAGLGSIDEAAVVKDAKKGDYYLAKIERPGRAAADVVAEVIAATIVKFPWPKSQRWGDGTLTWVRPLHSMICMLNGQVVPVDVDGIVAGNTTRGHRFHGGEPFAVKNFKDYVTKLKARKVLLAGSERAAWIDEQAREIAGTAALDLVEDQALIAENAGLTEWPTVLIGTFDPEFLQVPADCLISAMKIHQKCFALRDETTGQLANRFLLVSNLVASDGGRRIVAGNERVIRARLADAKFFWDQDLKRPLDDMRTALRGVTFHEKLGSQWDRVERVAELAYQIAGAVDAVPEDARRAAQLAKADLVSGMVGEFPELQGLMGRRYAEVAGTKPEIARAIELHYKPKGPTDTVATVEDGDAVAVAVALADKLDTLVGFWAIGAKPTGSGDPFQLRRAALGVIRIVLENDLRIALRRTLQKPLLNALSRRVARELATDTGDLEGFIQDSYTLGDDVDLLDLYAERLAQAGAAQQSKDMPGLLETTFNDLLAFFAERLKVHLREKGARHDLIDAVFALGGQDDLALIVRRVEALSEFLESDDGANLLAGVKRAANILAIEEKKDKVSYAGTYSLKLLTEKSELALAAAIEAVKQDTVGAIHVENFAGAMRALAELRAPVDAFFEHVIVNTDDPEIRKNRLHLLSEIRAATLSVADFSKIAG